MIHKEPLPGDIVWLKSGSPKMTVKFWNQHQTLTCTWFVGTEVKEHGFAQEQLVFENPNEEEKAAN